MIVLSNPKSFLTFCSKQNIISKLKIIDLTFPVTWYKSKLLISNINVCKINQRVVIVLNGPTRTKWVYIFVLKVPKKFRWNLISSCQDIYIYIYFKIKFGQPKNFPSLMDSTKVIECTNIVELFISASRFQATKLFVKNCLYLIMFLSYGELPSGQNNVRF